MNQSTEIEARKQELDNCTFVKTVLMVLIVFYHSILFWNGKWFVDVPAAQAPILVEVSAWLNSFHIYAFTLVSGYLFAFLKWEKGKYGKFWAFVQNKAKRLLVPYLFIAAVWVIPVAVYFFNYGFSDIVVRFVLATSPNQLWFLWMLFDVFILFWILSSFFEKHNLLGGLLVLVIYAIGILGSGFVPNCFRIWTACTYAPIFWLGMKIRQHGSCIIMKIPAIVWIAVDIGIFAIDRYLLTGTSLIEKLLSIAGDFALHVIGAIMAFAVLQKLANRITSWRKSKIFSLLSSNAMPIYLIHQQLIYFSLRWLNGLVNPYVHALINFAAAMLVSLIISTLLMRFKVTRFLIGEKI